MRPLIFALTLSFAPLLLPTVWAQETPPQTAEVRPDAIAKGEIGLEGRIKAINGPGLFDIAASSFTTEDGRTIEFDEAKPKSIQAIENAMVVPGDDLKVRLALKDVKLGLRVRLIGRNVNGQPFQARMIILSDVSSKYQKGRAIKMSAPVAIVMYQGAQAFDAGDFNRALTLYKQAQGIAAGAGDKGGLTSSLGRQASAYVELNQLQKADETFAQALKVAETGSPESLPTVLTNYALLMQRTKRLPEAVALLERARTLSGEESENIQVLIIGNLASTYGMAGQWDKAEVAWAVLPGRLRALGKLDSEVNALLNVALAQFKTGRTDVSTKTLAAAQERYKALTDPTQMAEAQAALGDYYRQIDDKAAARTWLNQALTSFETLTDARSAANVRTLLEALDKPAAPETPDAPKTPAAPETPNGPPAPPAATNDADMQ